MSESKCFFFRFLILSCSKISKINKTKPYETKREHAPEKSLWGSGHWSACKTGFGQDFYLKIPKHKHHFPWLNYCPVTQFEHFCDVRQISPTPFSPFWRALIGRFQSGFNVNRLYFHHPLFDLAICLSFYTYFFWIPHLFYIMQFTNFPRPWPNMPTFQAWKKPPQFSQSFKNCTNPCYKKLMTVGINAWPVTHGILNLKDDNHKMKAKRGAARVSRKHPQLAPIQSFSKHPLIKRNQLGIQDGFLGLLLLLLLLLLR